ncbi:MAG: clostripain-related cysteine peptidase [Candidatus Xenobia bacterium]
MVSPFAPLQEGLDSIEPLDVATLAEPQEEKPEGLVHRLAHAALDIGLMSAVGGAALTGGMYALTAAGLPTPSTSVVRTLPVDTRATPITLASHLDATERTIEPISTEDLQSLENVQQTSHMPTSVDVSIDRVAVPPSQKLIVGDILNTITVTPFAAGIYGFSRGRKNGHVVAKLLGAGALVGGVMLSGNLAFQQQGLFEAFKEVGSASMAVQSNEATWSGHREYAMENGQRVLTDNEATPASENPDKIADFLAASLKAHPGMSVVHLSGHGNSWHSTAGLNFPAYQKVLEETAQKTGHPIDLLLLDSCLAGNSEAVISVAPTTHYALVSEETTDAGTFPSLLQRTLSDPKVKADSPEALGRAILGHIQDGPGSPSTLALVDMQKVPELKQALDRLGHQLAVETKAGNTTAIQQAITATPVYPQESVYADVAKELAIGDLQTFAQKLVDTTPATSALHQDAQATLTALHHVVIAQHNSSAYASAGGLSVQLPRPGQHANVVVNHEPAGTATLDKSGAPAGWLEFIHTWEGHQ